MTQNWILALVIFVVVGVVAYSIIALLKKVCDHGKDASAGVGMKNVYKVRSAPWFRGFVMTPLPYLVGGVVGYFMPEDYWGSYALIRVMVGIGAGSLSNAIYGATKNRVVKLIEDEVPIAGKPEPNSEDEPE